MTPGEFDAIFDLPWRRACKLETRGRYVAPGEAERIAAFERGDPRPVRSVRTDPWLARVAVTTATPPVKHWQRIRVLDSPLPRYQQYGMAGLAESQAAGEEVMIAQRAAVPGLWTDFWLFDTGTPGAFMLLMEYGDDDVFQGAVRTTHPAMLAQARDDWALAMRWAVPLNEYVAAAGKADRAA